MADPAPVVYLGWLVGWLVGWLEKGVFLVGWCWCWGWVGWNGWLLAWNGWLVLVGMVGWLVCGFVFVGVFV